MGKSSPSPPPAPDYAGAAREQGAANEATARLQGRISNPNIIGPLGGQTVTWGTPTFDQGGYDKAMAAYQSKPKGNAPYERQFITGSGGEDDPQKFDETGYQNAMNSYMSGNIAPTREQFTTNANADQATVTQTLTPQAQATLDAQQRVQRSLAGLGEQGIGTARNVLGNAFNPNLAGLQTNVGNVGQIPQTPDLRRYGQAGGNINAGQISQAPELSAYGMAGANVNAQPVNAGPQGGQYGMAGAGPQAGQYGFAGGGPGGGQYGLAGANVQAGAINQGPQAGQYGLASGALNTGNVAAMPVNAGMTGQQAIMNRLAPQLERSDRATQQRLANQGLVPGGEAFENAMISQNQQKNDLLTQAALQGIGLDTAANAQGFNQALQAGQYGNQAIGQNFGQAQAAQAAQNAAQQQAYAQQFGLAGLQNQAIGQNFGQGVTAQQLQNAMQNQQYNQGLQSAQFGNTAQQQDLQQQLLLQNQPLNQILGLMSGSQIQMPQFQGYSGSNVAPPPIFAGAQAAGQSAMDQYGIQSANVNAQNAGLYNLAGSAGMAFAF